MTAARTSDAKLYFAQDDVKLYHGDCLSVEVAHDVLVTDPPYGQEFESGKAGGKWGAITGDDDLAGVHQRLAHVLKGLKRGRHAYIFGNRIDFSKLPLCGIAELVWDKGIIGMGDLSLPWGPQHEVITFAVYELSKANREKGYGNLAARVRKGSVIRNMRPNSGRVKHHPTEKPVEVLRQLIESSSVMGETVYDPFAGSGSTLIAAALEGRKAVGVEIDEFYCESAAKRFERELPAPVGGRMSEHIPSKNRVSDGDLATLIKGFEGLLALRDTEDDNILAALRELRDRRSDETPAVAATKDMGDLLMAITTLRQKTEDAEVLAKHVWDTATALKAVAHL